MTKTKTNKIKVLITSGGMLSKIDDIRFIGNFSTGETGAKIAEEFLRKDAEVYYIYSKRSSTPFTRSLAVDPKKPFKKEIQRIKKTYMEFLKRSKNLHEIKIETFEEYYEAIKTLLTKQKMDIAVLAAAVSDYGTEKQAGKISSDKDELIINLKKNPKIISLVKEWNPRVFQVGFKLLSGSDTRVLIEKAYLNGLKNNSNLTVANTLVNGKFEKRETMLITPEKHIIPVKTQHLPKKLVEVVLKKFKTKHLK
jgi:phosphopantothenate-cysteine ligase